MWRYSPPATRVVRRVSRSGGDALRPARSNLCLKAPVLADDTEKSSAKRPAAQHQPKNARRPGDRLDTG